MREAIAPATGARRRDRVATIHDCYVLCARARRPLKRAGDARDRQDPSPASDTISVPSSTR